MLGCGGFISGFCAIILRLSLEAERFGAVIIGLV